MIPRDHRWLGDVVVAAGRLAPGAAPPALKSCTIDDAWNAVCAAAALSAPELAQLVSQRFGLPLADLIDVDPAAAERLPPEAHRNRLMRVLRVGPEGMEVAVADPSDVELPRLLQFVTGLPAILSIASPTDLRGQAVPERPGQSGAPQFDGMDVDSVASEEPAIVRLCNRLFRQAVQHGVSDIHIQPQGTGGVIRMRIDGVLQRVASLQHPVMLRLVARIKLLATMDPTDRMRPQDGRLRLRVRGHTQDVRVSTVPANGEEKLVARILGTMSVRSLQEVGIGYPELDQLSGLLSRGQGMVLVTGPTGSGKTTTLYSALAERNDPGVNIATVEDPVEIRLPWLAQIEVNAKADLTFASALRSVLRQDPDIVMIGEIRDTETARIAVRAAITGHLVLASLHTNDAVTTVPRLLDLGVSPQLMGDAFAGASAQRLLRRLCAKCARAAPPTSAGGQWLAAHAGILRLKTAPGCPECRNTGFKGRVPVCQVFEFTREMGELVEAGKPLQQLRALARQGGMRTLAESAADWLRVGETSLEEVLRELGSDFWLDLGRAYGVAPFRDSFVPRSVGADSGEVPVLLIWPDEAQRHQAGKSFRQAGFHVLEAPDAGSARELLARDSAATAVVADLSQLRPGSVTSLLGLRDTAGGAAIPILALRGADATLEAALQSRPGVIVRERPASYSLLPGLLREAIAAYDREVSAALDRGE